MELSRKDGHIAIYFDGWYTAGNMNAGQPGKSA